MRMSKSELAEFFEKSYIWKDICDELDEWISDNHILMEDPDGTMELKDFKHHAAICHALRRVKQIDIYMLTESETDEKENQDG